MGHKSSRMTQDLYTTFDPTVTKQDIIDLYTIDGVFLYPDFNESNALIAHFAKAA